MTPTESGDGATGYGARLHVIRVLERFSMKRKLAGAAILMLVAVAGAGCGDDDGGGGAEGSGVQTVSTPALPTGPLTKAQFIEQGDVICTAAAKRIDAGGAKLQTAAGKSHKLNQAQIVSFLTRTTVPAYEQMVVSLRKLTPPAPDKERIAGFIAAIAGANDAIKANPQTYAKLTTRNPYAEANRRAKAYGFKVCGS